MDAIDRQAAIDAVTNHCIAVLESHTYDSITTDVYEMAHRHVIDVLRVFPSVQSERKKGKWIHNPDPMAGEGFWHCSECDFDVYDYTDFCPDCGADMRGET